MHLFLASTNLEMQEYGQDRRARQTRLLIAHNNASSTAGSSAATHAAHLFFVVKDQRYVGVDQESALVVCSEQPLERLITTNFEENQLPQGDVTFGLDADGHWAWAPLHL
jgi:hypothetical protein